MSGGLIDAAAAIITHAERSLEVSAHNIANVATPGFKKRISFEQLLTLQSEDIRRDRANPATLDLSTGKLTKTGSPFDIALSGRGFFVVRAQDQTLYTRNGQYTRDAEGRLTTAGGHILQDANGSDVRVGTGQVEITADGTIIEDGAAAARLAIADFMSSDALVPMEGGTFAAVESAERIEVEHPLIRQGMLETSNVSTGDEMVAIMATMRRAEAGQRIVSTYDDLIGRAITAFGQG